MRPGLKAVALSTLLVLLLLQTTISAAVGDWSIDRVWTEVDEAAVPTRATLPARPTSYRVFELDGGALDGVLARAPMEFTVPPRAGVMLMLPMPEGVFQRFRVVESPILSPRLSARYPDIATYAAQGVDDPTATVRFDLTLYGFRAQILSAGGTVLIDPFQADDTRHYISYRKRDFPRDDAFFECGVKGDPVRPRSGSRADPSGDELHTYRLAVTATGEYTEHFGGVAQAQAQITTTFNRVTGIYERDLAIRFNLTDTVIYDDPDTDPFPTGESVNGDLLNQNQAVLDAEVGSANYDIGHIVSQGGGGGLASLNASCNNSIKARGGTSRGNPSGDPFDVDYVAHEVGHQCGGNHTFNGTTGSCGGGNRNAGTAYEPGSGSTIQAYAGICGAEDLQPHSDDYFHGISLDEMITHRDGGGACAVVTATGNTPPTANAGFDFTIPTNTPFKLTGSGSDPDGDALTFCWEQFDLGDASPPPNNANGPLFRSMQPTADRSRTFPRMEDILSGVAAPWEFLPTVDRGLNFRLTVRDNRANGGGINDDEMVVTVAGDPFYVTSPNGGETFHAGCSIPVTWVVGGGNAANRVRIRISLDGGSTWETLVTTAPNTGSETVTLPCVETTTARIMVEAVDNIFFDVSDGDFELVFPEITVVSDVDWTFDPPNPWVQDGLVVDFFDVSSDADLFNIHFVADPLQDPSVPCEGSHTKMISGDLVEFVPEVINYLEAGDIATIEIKIVVPVGQHTGEYDGLVHVLAEPGCGCSPTISEAFEVAVEVENETDVDFADDRGVASRDLTVHLVGAKLDDVSGTVTVVNPDSDASNPDMADGPGNVRIELLDTVIDDLVKVGDPAVTIPASAITLLGSFSSLASGEAEEIEVMVSIPDGIPVNATYMGTVTLDYESCLGGQEVSDTFTIMLEVLQTQGELDIVASEINLDFCYIPPWLMPGEVEFSFDIMAIGDHRNIRISTGGLEHPTLPTKLEDFAFFPEEIAFLSSGDTRTVDVIVTIPIGQHAGLYSGYIQIVSENHGEDQVPVTLDVCGQYDLDIRDNYANLSGNVMEVSATARSNQSGGEWALRAFDIGLPDAVENNYDDFDGPGNAPINCVTYEFAEWSDLWQDDDQGHNYQQGKHFTGEGSVIGELCDWDSGEFRRLLVAIFVPKMTGNDNHPGTYKGRLDCRANITDADEEVGHDFFDIEVHLFRAVSHADEDGESDFGGYPDDGGARLYWGRFDQLGLAGAINLYRGDDAAGMYSRLNSAPLDASSSYLDTEIEAGEEYDYRLGIGSGDSEVFIGPVTVGGAPKVHYLGQNSPNPFRDGTSISYDLPSRGHVSLKIYDVSGRLVRVLRDYEEPAGFYTAEWDRKDEQGREVASGVYFYSFSTPLFEETRKMVVLR